MSQRTVGIVVFPEVEILDVCGPFEVFAAVRLDEANRRHDPGPYRVVLVAERLEQVRAHGGLRFLPDHTLEDCPALNVLVVPGGWGVRREVDNQPLVGWIGHQAAHVEVLASVCTGALLLARAGLLAHRTVTTHASALDWLRHEATTATVLDGVRVTDNGPLLTSGGVAAGIDLALSLVARQHGEAIARATARHIEIPYPDPATIAR